MKEKKERINWPFHLLSVIVLIGLVFIINRNMELKGLYMDDLYLWSCYADQSAMEFIFSLGGSRFRFVFNILSYIIFKLVGNHVEWFLPLNCLINGLIAGSIYWAVKDISRSKWVGFLTGVAFALSRFSYYQINMVYGLMESFALWGAILILYFLYRYINDKTDRDKRWFFIANICYFLTVFIHERYMVLLPLLIVAVFIKGRNEYKKLLVPIVNILVILGIRLITIGSIAPAGTAGTDVMDTFHFQEAMAFAIDQVKFIFGINTGNEIFTGINWIQLPWFIKLITLTADLAVIVLIALFLYTLIRSGKEERRKHLCNSGMIFLFIAMCIASSSVTVRLEMRWIYSGYVGALFLLGYMFNAVFKARQWIKYQRLLAGGLVLLYVILLIPQELCYKSFYKKLYYWEEQGQYNSLAEETYEKYGNKLFDKTILILENKYKVDAFTAKTFFRTFHKEKINGNLTVDFIDSIQDFGLVTDEMLILSEDLKDKSYQDVTDFVRNLKFRRIEGCYEDGWMDEHSEFELMAGSTGKISFECYYPEVLTGNEEGIVRRDGIPILNLKMNQNQMIYELQVKPYETLQLTIDNNFYVKDAKEKRGKNRLSMVIKITAN